MARFGFNSGRSSRGGSGGQKTLAEVRSDVSKRRIATRFSTLWPMLIILFTLMLTTTRDFISFRNLKREVVSQNAELQGQLTRSGDEVHIIDAFKDDLTKISDTDPVAARIVNDFFPGSSRAAVPIPPSSAFAPTSSMAPGTVTPAPGTMGMTTDTAPVR